MEEILRFESMLASEGTLILKYWLHISQEEQFRRFKEREETGHKWKKLTDESFVIARRCT
ncbi:MAG: hypothetical protein CL569_00675 [Alphaproteobacteria bacterium]|nr:hypothetical protein [Alphaproteobacteria bacterium]